MALKLTQKNDYVITNKRPQSGALKYTTVDLWPVHYARHEGPQFGVVPYIRAALLALMLFAIHFVYSLGV